MNNINEYNEEQFKRQFEQTNICQQLQKDFDVLSWSKKFNVINNTPRFAFAGPRRFSVVPFYYLEKLIETNPDNIYDLGCGWNIFKKYIPKIIGIGAESIDGGEYYGDIHDCYNDEFVSRHQDYFESIFSINALHFVSLSELKKLLFDFLSIVKSGGRGFLALNLARIIDQTPEEFLLKTFSTKNPTTEDYDKYVRTIVLSIPCNFLIVDIDLSQGIDDVMDGTIRLVFEKNK